MKPVRECPIFKKNRHSIVAKCSPIRTRALKYKCFKVHVNITNNIDLYDANLWPLGVSVGEFFTRPLNQNNDNKSAAGRTRHHSAE